MRLTLSILGAEGAADNKALDTDPYAFSTDGGTSCSPERNAP